MGASKGAKMRKAIDAWWRAYPLWGDTPNVQRFILSQIKDLTERLDNENKEESDE